MTVSRPSEGWDINLKIRTKSFHFKLWIYFILFTALIFTVLWLLQTVFLQSFYNAMVMGNTRNAAREIIENSQSENIQQLIDQLAHENSILVFITDRNGKVLYSSDEFKSIHMKSHNGSGIGAEQNQPKGEMKEKHGDNYRELPLIYGDFTDQLEQSESGYAEFSQDGLYVYGSYIDYADSDDQAILYVSVTIDAVGSSVTVISIQLVWVTVLSLLAGFILSWFIARRFSRPVDVLSEKAKRLGEKDYSDEFRKGFCAELDDLSDTLNKTNDKLNRSRDFQMELLANVSHDLRTPLTMIKGYAEMIRDISWEDKKQSAEDLAVIIKEADRLTALVNEIMEYSELQTDSVKEELMPVNLSQLVEKAADRFETLYKPDGIVIERNIHPEIIIIGHIGRLERALYNLMDNAFRHTGNGKKIRITLTAESGKAKLSVTDFGSGISQEELPHIWDRYYTSRQRKGKGVSGLGLAIVKQITELHSGICQVETEPGKGSTFTLLFNLIP